MTVNPILCPIISACGKGFVRCQEDECAWWNSYENACAVKVLASSVKKAANKKDG